MEYRGYDSYGIAVLNNNEPLLFKEVGKLNNLISTINKQIINSLNGIGRGHTRWATHGKVTKEMLTPTWEVML